jgi:hypothetical protein
MGRVKSSTPLGRILTFARLFTGLTSAARIQRMFNSATKEEREIFLAGDRKFPNWILGGELHHVGMVRHSRGENSGGDQCGGAFWEIAGLHRFRDRKSVATIYAINTTHSRHLFRLRWLNLKSKGSSRLRKSTLHLKSKRLQPLSRRHQRRTPPGSKQSKASVLTTMTSTS